MPRKRNSRLNLSGNNTRNFDHSVFLDRIEWDGREKERLAAKVQAKKDRASAQAARDFVQRHGR